MLLQWSEGRTQKAAGSWSQRLAGGAGVACAIHCAVLPLLAGAGTLVDHPHVGGSFRLEEAVFGLLMLAGIPTFVMGYRAHGRHDPALLFLLGVTTLLGSANFASGALRAFLAVAGVAVVLAAQWRNNRLPHGSCCGSV